MASGDGDALSSMESDSGLKALFQSAREFEAQRACEARVARATEEEAGEKKEKEKEEEKHENVSVTVSVPVARGSEKSDVPITAASLAEKRALEKEARRLVNERAELMGTGAYASSDRVISLIDEKIAEITEAVAR